MASFAQAARHGGHTCDARFELGGRRGEAQEHHCHKLKKLYQSNRTEIIWTSGDFAQFNKYAPEWVQRILTAGCETGLRAADLVQVKMDQFEDTPHGKRLRFRTSKRGQIAFIPATAALEKLIV